MYKLIYVLKKGDDMSIFSEKLKSYTDRCNIPIVTLAKKCGIDRTLLHKVISGERRAPNEDFVEDIARILMLSTDESEELMRLYKISVMGEDIYSRRVKVMEILSSLSENDSDISWIDEIDYELKEREFPMTFCSKRTVAKILVTFMASVLKKGGQVCLISQPDGAITEVIRSAAVFSNKGSIMHIFCFDNSKSQNALEEYNLELFPGICTIALSMDNYIPMYYYDDIKSHINTMTILPVMAIMDNYVMCAQSGLERAIFYNDKKIADFYRRQFERIKEKSFPFAECDNTIYKWLDRFDTYSQFSATFSYQPSFLMVIPGDMASSHLICTDAEKELVISRLFELKDKYYGVGYVNIFSEDGLKRFMQTGEVLEFPPGWYRKPDRSVRKKLLENIIELTENDLYNYRVVNEKYAIAEQIKINYYRSGSIQLVLYRGGSALPVNLDISEQSISYALTDYIDYLNSNGFVCSKSQSIQIMRQYLSK